MIGTEVRRGVVRATRGRGMSTPRATGEPMPPSIQAMVSGMGVLRM